MIAIGAVLGGLGLACMVLRRTLLGFLIGAQLLVLGATTAFVLAGASNPASFATGHLFALFIVIGGVGQLVAGYALAIRLFFLRTNADMSELKSLRH